LSIKTALEEKQADFKIKMEEVVADQIASSTNVPG
jgi:hypothetical protein